MLHACSNDTKSGSWHGESFLLRHLVHSGVYCEVDMSSSLQPECRKNGRFLWSRAQSDRPWSGLQMTYRRDRWSLPCHSKQCCSCLVSTACFWFRTFDFSCFLNGRGSWLVALIVGIFTTYSEKHIWKNIRFSCVFIFCSACDFTSRLELVVETPT